VADYKMFPERTDSEVLRLWNDETHRMTVGPVLEAALRERGYTTRHQDGTLRFPLDELIQDVPAAPGRTFDLYTESDEDGGQRNVWLRHTKDGGLILEGQDLGGSVRGVFGGGEYEWAWALTAQQLPKLLDGLGLQANSATLLEDVAGRLQELERSELQERFKTAGAQFWSHVDVDW
jgi:hypothetical protein